MAIQHLTYLEIPQDLRDKEAAKAISQIRTHLSNPTLEKSAKLALEQKLTQLALWQKGSLGVTIPEIQDVVEVPAARDTDQVIMGDEVNATPMTHEGPVTHVVTARESLNVKS